MSLKYKGYLLDLDGTMYRGMEKIPSAKRFIERLQSDKIPFLFVTNNATRTPKEVAEHLAKNFDILVSEDTIYTSGIATIDYLNEKQFGKKVMVIAENAIKEQLLQSDYELVHEQPDVVVQSLSRTVHYQELEQATLAIRNGIPFVVTNEDSNIPSERGFLPGSGATTAFLKTATQVEPVTMGKPNQPIMLGALKKIGLTKDEVIMVGDNYQTDILAGVHAQMDTLMVLTGFSTRESIQHEVEQPTYIVETLDDWSLYED